MVRLASLLLVAGAALCGWQAIAQTKGKTTSVGNSEEALVKSVSDSRKAYQESLHKLFEHYTQNGDREKARWVEEELRGFHLASKPAYRFDDVPPATLEGTENIKDANELLRQALQYKDRGFGSEYTLNQRRAEILLQELVARYPASDKISDAAYELGELYEGRAYKQYARSALYYERSCQWRKTGRTDARIRAARIYDKQLGDRSKAIEMYRDVVDHDTDSDRIKEAERRLADLTGGRR